MTHKLQALIDAAWPILLEGKSISVLTLRNLRKAIADAEAGGEPETIELHSIDFENDRAIFTIRPGSRWLAGSYEVHHLTPPANEKE